jgi:hypothetical protein
LIPKFASEGPRALANFGITTLGLFRARLEFHNVPDQGKVWLSYNSADYLYKTIYPRHGAEAPPTTAPVAKFLDEISDYATKQGDAADLILKAGQLPNRECSAAQIRVDEDSGINRSHAARS